MSEDVKNQIEVSVKAAIEEHLPPAIKTFVNGKIDSLREEVKENNEAQLLVNDQQNDHLKRIEDGTDEIIELFKGLKLILKGVNVVAKFLLPIGGAWGVIWAFIKWLK